MRFPTAGLVGVEAREALKALNVAGKYWLVAQHKRQKIKTMPTQPMQIQFSVAAIQIKLDGKRIRFAGTWGEYALKVNVIRVAARFNEIARL